MPRASTIRADRILTLSVVARMRSVASNATNSLPILMYHSIARDLDDTLRPYYRTVTSPSSFAQHIEVLREDGYEAITLTEAIGLLKSSVSGKSHFSRKVAITFDDGFEDFHTDAFPVLERAGFKATVFLATAFIGKPFINGRKCLGSAQVRALSDMGIEFGSHSVSHRRLNEISLNELGAELSDSKAAIEDFTGKEVTLFSYPFRFPEEDRQFTTMLSKLLDERGYLGGVTTAIGRSTIEDDTRFLPRLPVNDCDDALLLRAKLAGHYDWMRTGQRIVKRSRALWRTWVRA